MSTIIEAVFHFGYILYFKAAVIASQMVRTAGYEVFLHPGSVRAYKLPPLCDYVSRGGAVGGFLTFTCHCVLG